MKVNLTRNQILAAMPKIAVGLGKYLCIQAVVQGGADLTRDPIFQKKFNGFYRVRRNEKWRRIYFKLLEHERQQKKLARRTFQQVLEEIEQQTKRVEASFASKLVATVDPLQPVIDSVVLANVGGRLPYPKKLNRVQVIGAMHKQLVGCYRAYLRSPDGKFLVTSFKSHYPKARISEVKMLDLVIWQTRKAKPATSPKVRLSKKGSSKNNSKKGVLKNHNDT